MSKGIAAFFLLLFFVNPFTATAIFSVLVVLGNGREKYSAFLLYLFITGYACLVQSTVIWNPSLPSDWYSQGYLELYQDAKAVSFTSFVLHADKEPGWRLLNFIGNPMTGGNYLYFINGVVIASLVIMCTAIYKFWSASNEGPIVLIASLVLIVCFSEYLSNLNNISRHFFALSLVTFAYVKRIVDGKVLWWLLIFACSVHTIAIVFSVLLLIPSLFNIIKRKELMRITGIVLVFALIFSNVSIIKSVFSGIDSLAYGFSRLESANNPNDQNVFNSNSVYFTALVVSCACVITNYIGNPNRILVFFANSLFVLMAVCVGLVNVMPEVMGRLFVSRFFLFPFVLPYIFSAKNKLLNISYCAGVAMFFSFRYFDRFDSLRGGGFFPDFQELIAKPLLGFII